VVVLKKHSINAGEKEQDGRRERQPNRVWGPTKKNDRELDVWREWLVGVLRGEGNSGSRHSSGQTSVLSLSPKKNTTYDLSRKNSKEAALGERTDYRRR